MSDKDENLINELKNLQALLENKKEESITLKDIFAAHAMQGLIHSHYSQTDLASRAYGIAETMLQQRALRKKL